MLRCVALRGGAVGLAGMLGTVGMVGMVGGCGEVGTTGDRTPIEPTVVLGEVGMQPGQFGYPRAMDGDGRYLWVVDRLARVQRIDPRAEFRSKQWVSGWRMPALERGKPTGITAWVAKDTLQRDEGEASDADARTLIFVADTHYYRVLVYTPGPAGSNENAPVAAFGGFGTGPGKFVYVTDVAVLPSADGTRIERLYCSEYGGNDRVCIFEVVPRNDPAQAAGEPVEMLSEASGVAVQTDRAPAWFGGLRWVGSFGAFGSDEATDGVYFNRPQSVAIDTVRRELLVTDANHHRVGRFTLDGELIAWIGGREQPGEMGPSTPKGSNEPASARPSERSPEWTPEMAEKLALQDAGTQADASREITAIGASGLFALPYGVTALGDGTALVCEFGASRVQRIDLVRGTTLAAWGRAGRRTGELVNPWATCVIDGQVFVLDSGNNRVMGFAMPDLPRDAGGGGKVGVMSTAVEERVARAGGEP